MLKKKSIVLSSLNKKSNEKAVLTLEEDGSTLTGNLRLYNFAHNLSGISSLGFYVGNKVYKAGLTLKSNMLYNFFISLTEIPNKFSCAVVNFQNAVATPILFGSCEGNNDEIFASIIQELQSDNSLKNTKQVLDKYDVDFDDEEKEVIEKEIDDAVCGNCETCIYKKFFYENSSKNEQKNEKNCEKSVKNDDFSLKSDFQELKEINKLDEKQEIFANKITQNLDSENKQNEINKDLESDFFFNKLKPQIDKLFAENPLEDSLQNLIPSSKWVKVEYEDDGDFYVFGLLYDEDENVKFVCYGVPAVFEEEPPKELSGYPVWLPLDEDKQDGFGYWLTYQDASTGEPVKAIY